MSRRINVDQQSQVRSVQCQSMVKASDRVCVCVCDSNAKVELRTVRLCVWRCGCARARRERERTTFLCEHWMCLFVRLLTTPFSILTRDAM